MLDINKKFSEYKQFIEEHSQYSPKVVREHSQTSTHFPLVELSYSNSTSTNDDTIDRIERYDNEYLEISIYTQDQGNISRFIITEELVKLTDLFFNMMNNMYRSGCRPIPNIDNSISRTIISYQCKVGSVYGNIIRR